MSYKQLYQKGYPLCIFLLVLMILNLTTAFGAVIRVPADYQLIQTAIDAAADGDTVLVADGIYKGAGNYQIEFRGKAITVRSENGPQNCIIDCDGVDVAFRLKDGEGSKQELSGFTIINATYYSIDCRRSSPTITNCVMSGKWAGGIICVSAYPTISNCIIRAGQDEGIHCYGFSPTITNCIISGSQENGITCTSNSSPIITNCIISENQESGIYCANGTYPIITNCTISENQESGIYSEYSSSTISNCTITGNTTYANGGGILHFGSLGRKSTITNCLISHNESKAEGGGIACYGDDAPTITNCTISSNTSVVSGGGIYSDSINLKIANSILWGNSPDDLAPFKLDYFVTYSDIQGGHKGEGNIDADPKFVGNGDYHLTAQSPCIDSGTSEGTPDDDLEGNKRPQGNGYDMGAYEFLGSEPKPPPPKAKAEAMPWIPLLLFDD